jgi:hypothetical protein
MTSLCHIAQKNKNLFENLFEKIFPILYNFFRVGRRPHPIGA